MKTKNNNINTKNSTKSNTTKNDIRNNNIKNKIIKTTKRINSKTTKNDFKHNGVMHLADFNNLKKAASRDGYGYGLVELGKKNKNVMALCCDLTESTRVNWFKEKFPDRYIEVGIGEQNMIGIASGLASLGKIPFASSYAAFNPGRNFDQIRVSVCYSNLNVNIQGAHAGITVGPDGATHQALEDIAMMRVLPNMTVIVPCDSEQGKKATIEAARINSPTYLRFGRSKIPTITTTKTPFRVGKADIYRDGKDVCIIACGLMVYEALVAAKELQNKKINAMVINCHTIKPIDVKTIVSAAKKTKAIVTAEEHQINGGLGSAISEVLCKNYPTHMEMVGVLDTFGESGDPDKLLKKYKCKSDDIVRAVNKVLKRKKDGR